MARAAVALGGALGGLVPRPVRGVPLRESAAPAAAGLAGRAGPGTHRGADARRVVVTQHHLNRAPFYFHCFTKSVIFNSNNKLQILNSIWFSNFSSEIIN